MIVQAPADLPRINADDGWLAVVRSESVQLLRRYDLDRRLLGFRNGAKVAIASIEGNRGENENKLDQHARLGA